jgi:hypothetical protein
MVIGLKDHIHSCPEKCAVEHSLFCQLEMRPVCTKWLLTKTLNHHSSSGSTCICQHHEAANNRLTTQRLVRIACCCAEFSAMYILEVSSPNSSLCSHLTMSCWYCSCCTLLAQADRTILPSTATCASSGPPVLPVEECPRGILFRSIHPRRILVLPAIQGVAADKATQGVGE